MSIFCPNVSCLFTFCISISAVCLLLEFKNQLFYKIQPLLILIFTRSPLLYFLVCPQKSMLHEIFRFQFHSSIMYYVFPALVQSRSAGAKQQPSLSASLSRISLISVHTPFCLSFDNFDVWKVESKWIRIVPIFIPAWTVFSTEKNLRPVLASLE